MTVYKDFEKTKTSGFSLTEHGWKAWQMVPGNEGKSYAEFIRVETERQSLLEGIWHMIHKLKTSELRQVYNYLRSLHP